MIEVQAAQVSQKYGYNLLLNNQRLYNNWNITELHKEVQAGIQKKFDYKKRSTSYRLMKKLKNYCIAKARNESKHDSCKTIRPFTTS